MTHYKTYNDLIGYLFIFGLLIICCLYCIFEDYIEKYCYKKFCRPKKNPRKVIPLLTSPTISPLHSSS